MHPFKMHHQEFEPPDELKDAIKCFWHNRGDFSESHSSFEVLPDGYAEIIFYFGDALSSANDGVAKDSSTNDGVWQPLPSPFLMGLLNQSVLFHTKTRLEIIGIRCFPWAVFDLLGLPSGQDGVRVFEHPIVQLQWTLKTWIDAGRVNEALAQVTEYFLNARSQVAVDTLLSKAGRAMREAGGNLPVSQVATAAHATVRTLERKFKHASGYTVKDVSSLMRFERARNQLWLHPNSSLARLAAELGYTDQSHLSREFKRYSGTTPAAFARKAKREKQVASSDFVAFIQA